MEGSGTPGERPLQQGKAVLETLPASRKQPPSPSPRLVVSKEGAEKDLRAGRFPSQAGRASEDNVSLP